MNLLFALILFTVPAQAEQSKFFIKFKDRDSKLSKSDKLTCNSIDGLLSAAKKKIQLGSVIKLFPSKSQLKLKKACGYTIPTGQTLMTSDNPELFNIVECNFGCPDHNHFQLPNANLKIFTSKK